LTIFFIYKITRGFWRVNTGDIGLGRGGFR
jgi:hypothetical protein